MADHDLRACRAGAGRAVPRGPHATSTSSCGCPRSRCSCSFRSPAHLAGRDEPRQERQRGGRGGHGDARQDRPAGAGAIETRRRRDARPGRRSRSSTTASACRSRTARACSSPTSRPRATREPASGSPSCRRSSSSTAARSRSRMRRRRPARTRGALVRITLPWQDARVRRTPESSPPPQPTTAAAHGRH